MHVPNQEEADPVVERRMAALRARFPDRFSEADIALIEGRIRRSISQAEKLRAVPLANGEGPFFSPVAMSGENRND
jgi:hypothetical protein